MTDRARRRRRRTNRRAGVAIGAVVLLATGVTVALTSVSHSATYRLATVVTGDARTGLGEVGTVRPVNQSAVAFPVNGRVSTVDVEPGRRVTAGQQLASLDTAAMSAQLAGAHAATAKAQAKLDADQASQAAAPSTGASASRLGALQRTLTGDQHLADRDLEHARAAVAQAAAACGPGARPAPRPTERPTSSPTGPDPPPPADACRRAEAEALDWEVASDRDQKAVAADEAAVNQLAVAAAGARSAPAPATADQLAADQSALDADIAAEQAAQQSLDQAKLLSPEDGLVEAVNLTAGTQVTAESATQNVVISSSGGEEVVVDVAVDDLASVTQGERATVVPDGSTRTLGGTVSSIGVLPAAGGTATRPVTVVLDGGADLPDGATATVLLAPAGAGSATSVVVPTSAVTATAHGTTVRVDSGGHLTTVAVTVGVSGPVYTEITHGVEPGQRVVLADLRTPLPTTPGGRRGLARRTS